MGYLDRSSIKYLKGDVREGTIASETMIKQHFLTRNWINHHLLLKNTFMASHPISPKNSITELTNTSILFFHND